MVDNDFIYVMGLSIEKEQPTLGLSLEGVGGSRERRWLCLDTPSYGCEEDLHTVGAGCPQKKKLPPQREKTDNV